MTPDEIRERMAQKGWTLRQLAAATGIPENYLTKSLGKAGRKITAAEMDALRSALVAVEQPDPAAIRTIPHLGEVAASDFRPAEEQGGRRFIVSDPDTPHQAYALTVRGDSMNLVAADGTTLVIDPQDTALWPGRRYVVQTEDGASTFKEFQADPARLVPCSDNPEHREILLGGEPVKILGRVFSYTTRDLPRRQI